jgi:hypothetical protein
VRRILYVIITSGYDFQSPLSQMIPGAKDVVCQKAHPNRNHNREGLIHTGINAEIREIQSTKPIPRPLLYRAEDSPIQWLVFVSLSGWNVNHSLLNFSPSALTVLSRCEAKTFQIRTVRFPWFRLLNRRR